MSFSNWCNRLDKLTILICILFIVIIGLLILNYQKANQIYAPENTPEKFAANANNGSSAKNKLVLYYTNWCGYSKMFLPEWKKFKQSMQNNSNIECSEVDCEKRKEECKQVPGYPTVLLYTATGKTVMFEKDQNGKLYSRNFDGLTKFVNEYLSQ